MNLVASPTSSFPWSLNDLESWVVKRRAADGTVVLTRYTFASSAVQPKGAVVHYPALDHGKVISGSVGRWCEHFPSPLPVYTAPDGRYSLFIAGAVGTRAKWRDFDLTIDCGRALSSADMGTTMLLGTSPLVHEMQPFVDYTGSALQIAWDDRQPPDLPFEFFVELEKRIEGKILINCQGGHGRSGSLLVLLMMISGGYDSLDGVTHLRAIHCPRAIESAGQHEYLDEFSAWLGRPGLAHEAGNVKDFRARFLSLTAPIAKPYQDRLLAAGLATDTIKRGKEEWEP